MTEGVGVGLSKDGLSEDGLPRRGLENDGKEKHPDTGEGVSGNTGGVTRESLATLSSGKPYKKG